MKQNMLLLCALALVWIKLAEALQVDYMDGYRSQIDLRSPIFGSSSAGILKSHKSQYLYNYNRNITVSAPFGYSLLVAIRLIDLRPMNQDVLKISSINGQVSPVTYSNRYTFRDRRYYPNENQLYFVPNGRINITFTTGPFYLTPGYDGFELIYTVQESRVFCSSSEYRCDNGKCIAEILTCNGHNHCGDQSSQRNCYEFNIGPGRKVGITLGVIFLSIAVGCGIYIAIRKSRQSTTDTIITTHPPPRTNLPSYPPAYPQPGVYPPPPPPYSQGVTNPAYH